MEAIKCPNCGSEKVKELTEEKYECLACENVFLVHNLSKEFRKTDEHISQIHADLKNAINNINVISNGKNTEIDTMFENAFNLIKFEKYDIAMEKFLSLCAEQSFTYRAWWGKFLSMTQNLKSSDEDLICAKDVIECISNMRKCNDYPEEIENKLCEYLDSVFLTNKKQIEQKLQKIELDIKKYDKEHKKNNDKEQELYSKENYINRKRFLGKVKNIAYFAFKIIIPVLMIALAESFIINKLFIEWLGASIEAINEPPSVSAFLNLIAIPVKFAIGVVVAGGVAFLIWVILSKIFEAFEPWCGHEVYQFEKDIEKLGGDKKILDDKLKHAREIQRKLKKHIELYDRIDNNNLSTFDVYKTLKKNYSNL